MTMNSDTTTNEPEHLSLSSLDITAEKQAELLALFPEARTEGGKIDFDRLRAALGEMIDTGRERYGLTWPGKADCMRTIQAPSMATLRPAPDESVNFDSSENLIIEGDNLEVLKLLQKSYLGKVKMIYIDPPYNTGNDFIYPDNFSESLQTYLEYTGQIDETGRKFGSNSDTDGRFHSKWLNMMYPRLYLARNLLRDDGVIFITISDQEEDNLKKACHEIFGEENFVASVIWQKKVSPANDAQWFSNDHDTILLYARNKELWRPFRLDRNAVQLAYYKNPDNDSRGPWNSATYTCNKSKNERPNLYYPIKNPNTGEEIWPKDTAVWKYGQSVTERNISDGRLYWGADGMGKFPRIKLFLSEMENVVPRTIWSYSEVGHTQEAAVDLKKLFDDVAFDTPKPVRLIRRMLAVASNNEDVDIVLDFFAGSGTTAQAVLDLNKQDDGNRKFILVQLPEPTGRMDYPTIADITKERVRRVIKKLDTEAAGKLDLDSAEQDRGFRVFKLAASNFKPWNSDAAHEAEALSAQLALHVDHIVDGRGELDLLYEILLKSGYPLTTSVSCVELAGKKIYSVADGTLIVCLEYEITLELIRAIAELAPERIVCLDEGFSSNDQLKANAVQTFKAKGIPKFLTV